MKMFHGMPCEMCSLAAMFGKSAHLIACSRQGSRGAGSRAGCAAISTAGIAISSIVGGVGPSSGWLRLLRGCHVSSIVSGLGSGSGLLVLGLLLLLLLVILEAC